MAYQKTQWKDHIEGVQVGTPVNAVNMNKIEDGIAQAHLISRLDTLWEGSLTADNTTISLVLLRARVRRCFVCERVLRFIVHVCVHRRSACVTFSQSLAGFILFRFQFRSHHGHMAV